jgi:hypothetical protein
LVPDLIFRQTSHHSDSVILHFISHHSVSNISMSVVCFTNWTFFGIKQPLQQTRCPRWSTMHIDARRLFPADTTTVAIGLFPAAGAISTHSLHCKVFFIIPHSLSAHSSWMCTCCFKAWYHWALDAGKAIRWLIDTLKHPFACPKPIVISILVSTVALSSYFNQYSHCIPVTADCFQQNLKD